MTKRHREHLNERTMSTMERLEPLARKIYYPSLSLDYVSDIIDGVEWVFRYLSAATLEVSHLVT